MVWLTCFHPNTGHRDACLLFTRTSQDVGAPHLPFILWLILDSQALFLKKWSYFLSVSFFAFSVTSVVSDSLRPYRLEPARVLCPWDSPVKDTGVCCHALFLGIFLIQGSNLSPVSLALHVDFLPTGPAGKPFLLKDNKNFPLLDTIAVAVA